MMLTCLGTDGSGGHCPQPAGAILIHEDMPLAPQLIRRMDMKATHLLLYCVVWSAIGCGLIATFPGSEVASAVGGGILGMALCSVSLCCLYGAKGFSAGFVLGGIAGFVWGVTHVYESPVGGLIGGIGGMGAGVICGALFWVFAAITGRLIGNREG
jgi:hypothetical protein